MPMQCKSTHNTRTPCTNTPPPSLGARQGFLPLYHQITTGPTWHSKGILQTLLAIHPPFALLLQQYIKPSVSELQSDGGWLLQLFPQHIWALQPGLGQGYRGCKGVGCQLLGALQQGAGVLCCDTLQTGHIQRAPARAWGVE